MKKGLLSNHAALLGSLRSTFDTIVKCCKHEQVRLAGTPQAEGFVGIEGCALEGMRWIDRALDLRSAKLQRTTGQAGSHLNAPTGAEARQRSKNGCTGAMLK